MKLASVEFYSAVPRGHCTDRGLIALSACAKHKRTGQRGVGLRIRVHWAWGRQDEWFCNACAHRHEKLALAAALAAGKALHTRSSIKGCHLRLFDGAPTKVDLARARRMRLAAASTLQALGYIVMVEDDRGGVIQRRPTRRWRPVETCDHTGDRRPHYTEARL